MKPLHDFNIPLSNKATARAYAQKMESPFITPSIAHTVLKECHFEFKTTSLNQITIA